MSKEERIKEIAKNIPFLTLDREVFVSSDRKEWHNWMLSEEDTSSSLGNILLILGLITISREK